FVVDGEQGKVEVITGGVIYTVTVRVDRLAQKPLLTLVSGPDGTVKNGTFLKMHWPGIASYLVDKEKPSFYRLGDPEAHEDADADDLEDDEDEGLPKMTAPGSPVRDLLRAYAVFNPHATFTLITEAGEETFERTAPEWSKWRPSDPTSPHW